MTTPTLKPCPFCGKSVGSLTHARELADDADEYMHTDSWAVLCDAAQPGGPGGCGASGGFFQSGEEAIAAWNRRAAPSASVGGASDDPMDEPRAWELFWSAAGDDCSRSKIVVKLPVDLDDYERVDALYPRRATHPIADQEVAMRGALEALIVVRDSDYGRKWVWPETAHKTAMENVRAAIASLESALKEKP